ncbi:AP2 domain transcription factor AP2X-10 [Besnoitia besnoiti]|uniref:AP2 domain transcription factor AP2X-10 n=1 Tax=Besnoitia besnoiti TaxID=94643 RepID=A0A2A9MER4_BESBE|nr:AP2 domain transcription factor AP2X-10 [Besnoitia besnoiti]PFH37008.1 AP2 domain transcription factor AP2X-10 [Besnoitia besnoiti]
MPLQQQLQQLILGLQLLCELSPFCPALSSSASGSAHTKPAAGVTSASGAVEAATQGQHKTLPPRARVYGNPLGHLPPACEWLYPFSSRGAASGARLDQGSGTETECIGHGGAASLLQRLPPAASSGCCSCCCGCTFEAEHRCEARSSASSSESDKIHRRAEPSPMLEGHQGIRIHHCHGGRSGATERTSNARFQAPAGPDRRCSGTTGGVKGPTGNGCAVAEESTDSVEPVTTGAVGKQKRGRYRTAAVVAAEEGDATDIYKKPRPSVTSRRVLLQKQQQHIQESGAAADGDDEPTRAACSLSDANTLFSRFSSKSPTESSAATTYQLGQTQESVDDASREQRMQNLKTPTAARSPPSASLKRLAVGAMCADTYGLTRQNGLEPGVHSSSHGNLTACKATASDARGPAKEELSQNTQTASRRSEAAAPHLQKNESTSSHGNAPLSCKPTTASSGSAAPPVRTTRHNKTKQPGVFQFTRGIKRFWAASWYADGHPGWKAFSVEKWGNTEALKRAKKAYEEKVPHGAAMLNTLDFGAADDMASDDTPSLPVTGTGSGKDSNRTGSGSSLSVGSSQQRQRCDNGGEAQRSQDRGLTQQQVNGATRTGNTRKKQQPSQAGDGPAESPPLSLESGTIEYRSTPAGFSSSSSSSIFSCTTGQHMGDGVETTQKQHQIEREDFLQPIWDDLDSADTGNSGTGGVFTLGGASGGCATSSCYDTSSSSGFLRGKFSYSSKTAATELSVGYEDPISEGQRHVFFEHPRAHHDTELGRHGCDEPGIHEDDHGLLSPSQFFLGSDNDDITGRLLLSGPDTGALSISR